MGCSNGKMVMVSPASAVDTHTAASSNVNKLSGKGLTGSCASLDNEERPSGSATSKGSKRSQDSGYDANELDSDNIDEYANMITENSEGAVVDEIEKNFKPFEFDFCLNGIPAPRNLSAKDKARLDEQRILETLRNEGLITTSKFEAKSGLAFEVVEATTMPRRAIPARLARLDKKKKRKKTKEEIAEKLAKAERKRKEAENERLEKINAVTAKSDVIHVQEGQAKYQQELLENTIKKVDTVSEKREQKLQEVKNKLKARQEHAAKVRLRKKLHIPTQEELEEYERKNIEDEQLLKSSNASDERQQVLAQSNNEVQQVLAQSDNEVQQVLAHSDNEVRQELPHAQTDVNCVNES